MHADMKHLRSMLQPVPVDTNASTYSVLSNSMVMDNENEDEDGNSHGSNGVSTTHTAHNTSARDAYISQLGLGGDDSNSSNSNSNSIDNGSGEETQLSVSAVVGVDAGLGAGVEVVLVEDANHGSNESTQYSPQNYIG